MPLPMLMALSLLAQVGPAAAAAPAPTLADLENSPDWLRLPSDGEVAAAYPTAARRARVAGQALLDCALDGEGRLTGCKVAQETPAGYGFGQAALSLSVRFQMTPLYPDGRSVAGARVSVPISFTARQR